MTLLRPCLDCGEPSPAPRCPGCAPAAAPVTASSSARGYDANWRRLSERARRAQPFCADCGAREDLTTDHSPDAWARRAAGLAVRLADVAVVCRPCNSRRGAVRKGLTWGETPGSTAPRPHGRPESRSHFGGRS